MHFQTRCQERVLDRWWVRWIAAATGLGAKVVVKSEREMRVKLAIRWLRRLWRLEGLWPAWIGGTGFVMGLEAPSASVGEVCAAPDPLRSDEGFPLW